MFCCHYSGSSRNLSNVMKSFSAFPVIDDAVTLSMRLQPSMTHITDPARLLRRTPLYLDDREATPDRTIAPFLDFLDTIPNHQFSPLHHVQKPI